MIEAIIFDMDGVLVDSEPLWVVAEIEVFATVGVNLTPELCERTMGLRHDALVRYWYDRYPWTNKTVEQVAAELINRVCELLDGVETLPGVHELVAAAKTRGLKLALCSSSPYVLIRKVVAMLGLSDTLTVHSAEDEVYGKPHPAPYLTTAEKCGVEPTRCLVFEDSFNGAISAKAARMQVVGVPQGANATSTRFDFCDLKLASLAEFTGDRLDRFQASLTEDVVPATSQAT